MVGDKIKTPAHYCRAFFTELNLQGQSGFKGAPVPVCASVLADAVFGYFSPHVPPYIFVERALEFPIASPDFRQASNVDTYLFGRFFQD